MKVTPERLIKEVMKDLEALHKAFCVEAQSRIIDKAPTDTGALRASILAAVNTDNVPFQSGNTDPTGVVTKSTNQSVISSSKLGDTINIVVSAPYGIHVEQGTNTVAPTGFVKTTGEETDSIVEIANENLKRYRS